MCWVLRPCSCGSDVDLMAHGMLAAGSLPADNNSCVGRWAIPHKRHFCHQKQYKQLHFSQWRRGKALLSLSRPLVHIFVIPLNHVCMELCFPCILKWKLLLVWGPSQEGYFISPSWCTMYRCVDEDLATDEERVVVLQIRQQIAWEVLMIS